MGAKAILHAGKWRVQVNLEGQSRIISRLRDFVRNKEYGDQQVAEIVAEIINTQVLVGNFRWDAWFPQDRRKFKFRVLVVDWLSEERKPSTQYQYSIVMRKFVLQVVGDADVRNLGRGDFHWIGSKYGNTPKAKSIRNITQNFLSWCYREEIRQTPITLPSIILPKSALPYISIEDRNRIQADVQPDYQLATLLSLRMGLRAAEIAALEWDCVEWGKGITIKRNLSLYQTTTLKEGGSRFSPFQGEVEERLRGLHQVLKAKGILPAGLVLRIASGARMWPNLISWEWSKASKRVGVPAKMHWNRHSLGQDMLAEGFSIGEVAAILGHRSIRTSEKYYARHNRGSLVSIADRRRDIKKHKNSGST